MRVLFIALTVLSALITEGDCLACETCQRQGSTSCTGTLQTCAEGVTYCVKGFQRNTQGNNTILTAFKKCVEPVKEPACDRNIIFRSALISLRITRVCCNTDGCNRGDVVVPIINETSNGLLCPTGFTDLVCTGNEDFCGSLNGTVRRPVRLDPLSSLLGVVSYAAHSIDNLVKGYSIKGCHNQDACEVGILGMEASEAYDFNLTCTTEPPV